MTYQLTDPISQLKGIGPRTSQKLKAQNIQTLQDLLLNVPLRYEDRSQIVSISQLQFDQLATVKATLVNLKQYYKNRRRITSAVIKDQTGQTKCIWFNNRFIKQQLKVGQTYFFSGKFTKYRTLTQPIVEKLKADTIHTGRLVPLYTTTLNLKQGRLRRILKHATDHLAKSRVSSSLKQLHFPTSADKVIKARQTLALEELLTLMHHSHQLKQERQQQTPRFQLKRIPDKNLIPQTIPFTLTKDQQQALTEILTDLTKPQPMNRLLLGDVGSGKTVVVGIAAYHLAQNQQTTCLIAPTQILAKQHFATFKQLFPQLKTQLLTADCQPDQLLTKPATGQVIIGTHSVINQLEKIKPALVIYDEQHRFGVEQRQTPKKNKAKANQTTAQSTDQQLPHKLTMSATPIPRSYMLTIFSHLELSQINQLPFGPKPLKTWLVPPKKQTAAYAWIKKQPGLTLVVCPFIEPSKTPGLENIPAATSIFKQLGKKWPEKKIALLHGQMKSAKKNQLIKKLFEQKIELLVTTPIIEVGVDLPQANTIIIQSPERFGLASLHQLRGRVGRAGQKSYCLLFGQNLSQVSQQRLKYFCQETSGAKLAEYDLKNRGAGDLFGLDQHGFEQLQFASWGNLALIQQAKKQFAQIQQQKISWQPFF